MTTDKFFGGQDAQGFLKGLGLTVDETVIQAVLDALSTGSSLYALYNGAKNTDGSSRNPICGKGTAYKIKNLYDGGTLQQYVDYLEVNDGVQEPEAVPDSRDDPVPTGFQALDTQLGGGMSRGELLILAGRSGVGKSILAVNIIVKTARTGLSSGFVSLETTTNQLVITMLASEANVAPNRLKIGLVSDIEERRVLDAMDTLSAGVHVETSWEPDIDEIRRNLVRLSQASTLDLVIVDYLQLVEGGTKRGTRYESTDYVVRNLKAMARELNVPVLVLSQLGETQGPRAPRLSDVSDGAGVVAHADVVMLLHRVWTRSYIEQLDNDGEFVGVFRGLVAVNVAKNRHGSRGVANLLLDEGRLRYEDLAPATTQPQA